MNRRLILFVCVLCLCSRGKSKDEAPPVTKALPDIGDDSDIGTEKGGLHVLLSTECFGTYFVYQSLAMKYVFDKVKQPGQITRLMSCDDVARKTTPEDLEIMDTLVVPSWTQHPTNGDYYQAYNRPVSILFWLAKRRPKGEWTLILDPDMILRQPIIPEHYSIPEGYVMASQYNYLKVAKGEYIDHIMPEAKPIDDNDAGARGRLADEVGAFFLIRTRDLIKVAPLWLEYTEKTRLDPDAWRRIGGSNSKEGDKVWESEMYGYILAAAKIGLRHKADTTLQYYPTYSVQDIPYIIHYGLQNKAGNYHFKKHEHFDFDPLSCPPWSMNPNRTKEEDRGMILHPPFPSTMDEWEPRKRYGVLMSIEAVNTINKALCERHKKKCPEALKEVERECVIVDAIEAELDEAYALLHMPSVICHDDSATCFFWRRNGECEKTWMYMQNNCRASCNLCRGYTPPNAVAKQRPPQIQVPPGREGLSEISLPDKKECIKKSMRIALEDPGCRLLLEKGRISAEDFVVVDTETVIESGRSKTFALALCALALLFGTTGYLLYKTLGLMAASTYQRKTVNKLV